jgi:formamidopyrimidine-DNA glycosylase
MPELPDITVYIEALNERISGRVLESVTIAQPNLLRTAEPPVPAAEGRRVVDIRRLA